MPHPRTRPVLRTAAVILLALLVNACGYKGALTHPTAQLPTHLYTATTA